MKKIFCLTVGIVLITLASCNNFKSSHPQSVIPGAAGATAITDQSILDYASKVDSTLAKYTKELSLIYVSGDRSVYTERYSSNGKDILYKTSTTNGNTSISYENYYLKNDSLILVKEYDKISRNGGELVKQVRSYLRNHIIFKMDGRTAGSTTAITKLPYTAISATAFKQPEDDYARNIKSIRDAIAGKGKFEMVFDHITTYPDVFYITLKSKDKGNYTANLLVKNKDTFIDSLLNYPALFREKSLKLKWIIEDNEAIYIPAESTITSASGLNR